MSHKTDTPPKAEERPRRRIELTLRLGADSWEAAARAVDGVAYRLYEAADGRLYNGGIQCTSGGTASGWHLKADEDPAWDHDRYFAAIRQTQAGEE